MNNYQGFNLKSSPQAGGQNAGVLQKPGYYRYGQMLNQYGNSDIAKYLPGTGLIAGAIGGALTVPYDRQNDFMGEMSSAGLSPTGPQGQPTAPSASADTRGRLAGAVNLGNGLLGLPNGDVVDHTGTVVGGAVQNAVDRNGNPIGWGVGVSPNIGNYTSINDGTSRTLADPRSFDHNDNSNGND